MVHAESPPGSRRSPSALVLLLPVAVTAVATVIAVSVVSSAARLPVLWCGVVATLAVAVVAAEAARRGRAISVQRERQALREATLERRLADQEIEAVRLAEELLPQAVAGLQQGLGVEEIIRSLSAESPHETKLQAAHRQVLRSVLEAVSAEEDLREAAQRAFVNIARRVQAIVHQQARDLREMEDRHGQRPEFFADLLHIDHGTALIGRLADSIAVISGTRPGRQWRKPVPLFSVLRGAMSRITDYQRVELHSVSEVAIVGPTVEPLIHALAELLDNATRYSPPQTRVHLTAVEVQAGIAVEIEDGGVGLSEEARARAERVLRQAESGLDLDDLGETPRLGLAVVGKLAQAYGFQVSLRPSAYGGVRAVLIVSQENITTANSTAFAHGIGAVAGPRPARAVQQPAAASRPATGPRPAPALIQDDEAPVVRQRTPGGLPQRRRRLPDAVPGARAEAETVREADAPAKDAVEPGMWLAAFTSGVSGETPPAAPSPRSSDESLDKGE